MATTRTTYDLLVEAFTIAFGPSTSLAISESWSKLAAKIALQMPEDQVNHAKAEALRSLGIDSPSFDDADTTAQEE